MAVKLAKTYIAAESECWTCWDERLSEPNAIQWLKYEDLECVHSLILAQTKVEILAKGFSISFSRWAAACGDLELFQWAHGQGCPWDATTCAVAARMGRIKI